MRLCRQLPPPPEVQAVGEGEGCTAAELRQWVTQAYRLAGFAEDPGVGLVQMAAALEGMLDECLAKAKKAQLSPGLVEEREKAREKERRQCAALLPFVVVFAVDSIRLSSITNSPTTLKPTSLCTNPPSYLCENQHHQTEGRNCRRMIAINRLCLGRAKIAVHPLSPPPPAPFTQESRRAIIRSPMPQAAREEKKKK